MDRYKWIAIFDRWLWPSPAKAILPESPAASLWDPLASAAITTFYIDAGAGERLARINCGLHGRANIVEASQIPKTEKEPL
jgi:hypothetical protein